MKVRIGLHGSIRLISRSPRSSLSPGRAATCYSSTKAATIQQNRSFCLTGRRRDSPDIKITSDELFRYTEGRWFIDDSLNQELRYVKFDVHELCRRAAKAAENGSKVVRVDKLPSLNSRVLLLTMSDGQEFIAKIKCPISGPILITTLSELTTLLFLDKKTSIRAPEIYDAEADADSPLGAEYILMEKMKGVPLSDKWNMMTIPEQMRIIDQLIQMDKELASLKFPASGSLYPRDGLPSDSFKQYPLSSETDPDGEFAIGPSCATKWWYPQNEDGRQAFSEDCGPWATLAEYGETIIKRELEIISNPYTAPQIQSRLKSFDESQSIEEYEDLLRKARSVLSILSRDKRVLDIAEHTLRHTKMELSDIFVSPEDPTKIEGYIGWQSCQVLPLFVQVDIPNFLPLPASYSYGAHTFSLPDDFDTLSPEQQQSVTDELNQASRAKYYEIKRRVEIKKMDDVIQLDRKLWRLFECCQIFGTGSLTPLRNRLYNLFESWSALELPGACPFSVTEAEIQRQNQQEEKFMASLDVEDIVRDKLSTNGAGWIANDQWEEKMKENERLHEDFVETVSEDMNAESATQMWPFPPK